MVADIVFTPFPVSHLLTAFFLSRLLPLWLYWTNFKAKEQELCLPLFLTLFSFLRCVPSLPFLVKKEACNFFSSFYRMEVIELLNSMGHSGWVVSLLPLYH